MNRESTNGLDERTRHLWENRWYAWTLRILIVIGIALWWHLLPPNGARFVVVVICIVWFAKAFALYGGIRWIWKYGETVLDEVPSIQKRLEQSRDIRIRRSEIYAVFDKFPMSGTPFGIMDYRLRRFVDEWTAESRFMEDFIVGAVAAHMRELFFRFESLTLFSIVVLLVYPFEDCQYFEFSSNWIAAICTWFLLLNVSLMPFEILRGNALMQHAYSGIFHFNRVHIPEGHSGGMELLHEISNFVWLSVCAVGVIAITCMVHHACWGGFEGVCRVWDSYPSDATAIWGRARVFVNWAYFSTSLYRVGFSNIHATETASRFLLSVIQLIAAGYLLILLQVLLGQRLGNGTK